MFRVIMQRDEIFGCVNTDSAIAKLGLTLNYVEKLTKDDSAPLKVYSQHEIEDGRLDFTILVYNDKNGSMRKEFFTQ